MFNKLIIFDDRHRLHHLFGQIEKEFDGLISENVARN